MNNNIYEMVNNRIIEILEKGVIPWRKEWTETRPLNLISKKPYQGINFLLLSSTGYASPFWLTFNQVKSLGGSVKSGEHGYPVIFWKTFIPKDQEPDETEETEEKDEKKRKAIPLLRYYTVFNVAQTTLKIPEAVKTEHKPIEEAETIVKGYKDCPEIRHDEQRAYYVPARDIINMPKAETFNKPESYYSTLFHEMTHSTGHSTRLKRFSESDAVASFGSESYSNEELVAELGSAYMSAECGISNQVIDNQAAYIQGWLNRLRNDKKLIVFASARAIKAVSWIENK